jgi:hypothetical protein
VRFSSPLFLQQGVAKLGAILEGDGEISLPPVLQPMLFLGSPLVTNAIPAGVQNRTFTDAIALRQIGAGSASVLMNGSMGPGIWFIQGEFSACMTGTTNFAKRTQLQLISPTLTPVSIAARRFLTGTAETPSIISMWLSISDPSPFIFGLACDVGVAGDDITASFGAVFNKML